MQNKYLYSKVVYFFLFLSSILFSQTELDESYKIYDDTEVAIIRINMNQADLAFMLQNPLSDSIHLANIHFKNKFIDETVDSVGIRLRGNTSRTAQKKSLKLSFNTFIDGKKFYDVEKLNLNGEHNDPSIVRSKLSWDFFNDIGVVSTRASHAAVYINDKYYGLYISIEHIDENFLKKNFKDDFGNLWKCLYPADLNYINIDPNSYKLTFNGRQLYELKTNLEKDDYSELANLIDVLNNSSNENFKNSILKILDVPQVLNYFAVNILTGSWDDYWSLSNNYYLYHDPTSKKIKLIPYDYDNTFSIDWFNINWAEVDPYTFDKVSNGYRPLAERLMQVPEFRNLYTELIKFYISTYTSYPFWQPRINELKNLISSYAEADTFRTKDYGFSISDFHDSYFSSNYSNQHVKQSIIHFSNDRHKSLQTQLTYLDANPFVFNIEVSPKYIKETDSILVSCSVYSNVGIKNISIELIEDFSGIIRNYELQFAPLSNDLIFDETNRWEFYIPSLPKGYDGKLFIIAEDNDGKIEKYPSDGIAIVTEGKKVSQKLLLNEVMAKNARTISDFANEYDDWLEIYNPQDTAILLSNMYLTDDKENLSKWKFPSVEIIIEAGEHILIWCDNDEEQAGPHTNFKLSSTGEFLAIVEKDGLSIVDSVTFPDLMENEAYSRIPNLTNVWEKTFSTTPGEANVITDIKSTSREFQNNASVFPNPFNPSTTIQYELNETTDLNIKIFDILGKQVWEENMRMIKKGKHELLWEGKNSSGNNLAGGVYLLSINGSKFNKTIKLLLLK